MVELVTVKRFAIPEFAAFPLKKSILDEYLGSLPQDVIELSFMFWSSDTGFERSLGGGRSRKAGVRVPNKTRVLSAHYGLSEERWRIWVRLYEKLNYSLSRRLCIICVCVALFVQVLVLALI